MTTTTPSIDPPRRRERLARSARWFAAEFAVVVSGVLVALALNAYYQHRQAVGLEQTYLEQILAELEQSEENFSSILDMTEASIEQIDRLRKAFEADEPPTEQEFLELATLHFRHAEPVAGAAQALIMTGDLNLIRDDEVRVAIVRWVGWVDRYLTGSKSLESDWLLPAFREMVRVARPMARGDHPFTIDHAKVLRDPEYFTEVVDLQLALVNVRVSQSNTLEMIRATRETIESSLDPDRTEQDEP